MPLIRSDQRRTTDGRPYVAVRHTIAKGSVASFCNTPFVSFLTCHALPDVLREVGVELFDLLDGALVGVLLIDRDGGVQVPGHHGLQTVVLHLLPPDLEGLVIADLLAPSCHRHADHQKNDRRRLRYNFHRISFLQCSRRDRVGEYQQYPNSL